MELQNLKEYKNKLNRYDPTHFNGANDSFTHFVKKIKVKEFRHIKNLEISFDHPITVISGINKIGKTSILLLIACSHYNFMRIDSTKPKTTLRRHTWRDVLIFTNYESNTRDYEYELEWRVGKDYRTGKAKRSRASRSWSGVGKASKDTRRKNAQIRERQVRLIDLERILPARNVSNSLLRKISSSTLNRVNPEIEESFQYIFSIPNNIEIYEIGSHVNKKAFLIKNGVEDYSSYNAASGEESVINILQEIINSPKNSLILIDEVEAGFHPSIQRKIADIIHYYSWRHKKQFILTTHSPSFISAFHSKSRKFLERTENGDTKCINKISVNAAFSKMDSIAYPLIHLYCEDDLAEYILRKLLIKLNLKYKHFDRLINIIKSGPVNMVEQDYKRHKRNYPQMRFKIGYACVFDGDYKNDPHYSQYYNNPDENTFFLYPYIAPEKFLIEAYLREYPNEIIQSYLKTSDHHSLFLEMANQGLAADNKDALNKCWNSFEKTPEYRQLENDFNNFIINVTKSFSEEN